MEVAGAAVALSHSDGAAGPQDLAQLLQCPDGTGKVLKHKTDKDVIEALRRKGEMEDVRPLELDVAVRLECSKSLWPGLKPTAVLDLTAMMK